ncbi:MAG: hypothetical protein ABJN26_16665 [Stappiaceae bacterium]
MSKSEGKSSSGSKRWQENLRICNEANERSAAKRRSAPQNNGITHRDPDYGMLTSSSSFGCKETPKLGIIREYNGFEYQRSPYSSFYVSKAVNGEGEEVEVPTLLRGLFTQERLLFIAIDKHLNASE